MVFVLPMQKYEVNALWVHKILHFVQFWGEIRYLSAKKTIFGRKAVALANGSKSILQNKYYFFGCGL